MTISRTSSSRLDPAATPTGSAPAAPAAPATAGQAALPERR